MIKNRIIFLLIPAIVIVCFCAFIKLNKVEDKEKTEVLFIEQDWAKTLQTSKDSHKLIFLDLYATWCGPCKMLKKNTFTNKDVAEYFNSHFVNASVDVEKGIGITLAEQYNVSMLPTLIVANQDGKPILFTTGYLEPKEILRFAKAAVEKAAK